MIATVRAMPHDEDCEDCVQEAMEYDYEDYSGLTEYLDSDMGITSWEVTGNAVSIEARTKETIRALQRFLQSQNPLLSIGIEWDYWVE